MALLVCTRPHMIILPVDAVGCGLLQDGEQAAFYRSLLQKEANIMQALGHNAHVMTLLNPLATIRGTEQPEFVGLAMQVMPGGDVLGFGR